MILEEAVMVSGLSAALSVPDFVVEQSLTPLRLRRMHMLFCQGMSISEVAKAEGVSGTRIRQVRERSLFLLKRKIVSISMAGLA